MIPTIASLFLGLGLSASVGFRVFLPLLALSIAAKFNIVPVGENFEWVASTPAIIGLGFATILEILAFYIPWLDNVLDTIAVPTAAIAGTMVMASTAMDVDPMWKWAMAIIAGGGTASTVKGSLATTRLASTATTGGLANPFVTTIELIASAVLSFLSIFLWPVAAIITIVLLFSIFFFFKKIKNRWATKSN